MRLRVCVRLRVCGRWQVMWPFPEKLKPGVYHFTGSGPLEGRRMHLRVDSRDKGILIVDASRLITLNGTGIQFAKLLLEGADDARIVKEIRRRYRVKKDVVKSDLEVFKAAMMGVLEQKDIVLDMDDELGDVYTGQIAPFRMDLALTYRCDNDCGHCYNEKKRANKELLKEEWKAVLLKLWQVGIPHIVFTGGEPTLRDDLPQLIAFAEETGQITGLNTNGKKLSERSYLDELISSGLDHVQITLASHEPSLHDRITGTKGSFERTIAGIKNALDSGIYLVTNTTIMEANKESALDTIRFLGDMGVKHVAVNAVIRSGRGKEAKGVPCGDLVPILKEARKDSILKDYEFRWYSPTRYCDLDPMELELGMKQCTACRMNMAVEPDGTVIPCQSYYEGLGNILSDPWDRIWESDLCRRFRDRSMAPDECKNCDLIIQCGGGCPL